MQKRILGLDGLRAVAVGLVLTDHKTPIGSTLLTGGFGVHLFFVLSGFLIIGILSKRREAIEKGTSRFALEIKYFYENRLFRIWPPYYLVIAITLVLGAAHVWPPMSSQELVGTATFTSNIFQGYVWRDYPLHIGALWSVAVEEQFYLWAGAAFLLSPRRYYSHICLSVMALAILSGLLRAPFNLPLRSSYVGPLTNFGLMALGGYAAVSVTPNEVFARIAPYAFALFLCCPVLAFAVGQHSLAATAISWSAGPIIAVVLIGVVSDQQSNMTRFLNLWPLTCIGRISYGIYLYQGIIDYHDWGTFLSGSRTFGRLLELVILGAVSYLSWQFLEKPLLRFRDRHRSLAQIKIANLESRS